MSVTRRLALATASVTVGVGLAFAPAAQATDSGGAGIRSSHNIAIAENAPLYGDGETGYVGNWDISLTHSHLDKCT